jgi:dTDP-4-dehydrorhamnose 3,5-epimerase
MTSSERRSVGERLGLRLVIVRHPQVGIGKVINDPGSPHLIRGVEVEPLVQFPDDRGAFAELFRFGEPGLARDFLSSERCKIQISVTTTFPGVIKALHYHFEQTDLWAPVRGMFQVCLCDLREGSSTCGSVNTLFVGALRPWKLRIPPGVAHGYKIVGPESGQLVYATDRFYNPEDEGRIAHDDPDINYDWEVRPR